MTSVPSPQVDPTAFWDGRYGEPGYAYGEQPNDFLREQAAALAPGEALCLAEGEGRNAVHLTQLGHRVLAQDLSAVGLAKAEALARSRGVLIETSCGGLAAFHPSSRATIWWWRSGCICRLRCGLRCWRAPWPPCGLAGI